MQLLWNQIQTVIKNQVIDETWEQFFKHLSLAQYNDKEVVFEVPDAFFLSWFENHYLEYLSEVIRKSTGKTRHVSLVVRNQSKAAKKPSAKKTAKIQKQVETQTSLCFDAVKEEAPQVAVSAQPSVSHHERVVRAGLNPRYTFDDFVVGGSNQFCNAACLAVSERPSQVYNPLFLFGGVGLGKTHLLHAVGNELLKNNPELRVMYVTSEQFMNELIHSLRTKDTNAFRKKFRDQCDVLLMDDIQFIAGKDSTQEEFFHTFNALHQAHRQIIITSDKMPHELPGLEERLRSRFGWGLIADIQPPDIETRIAIIKKKAESEKMVLNAELEMFLASHIRSNVRELEGCLLRLKAFSALNKQEITLDLAKKQLRAVIREQTTKVTVDRIQHAVAGFYSIKINDLVGPRRHRFLAHPRHVAMYLSRRHTNFSFPEIGRCFGGRDHSTVMNAVKKIEKQLKSNDDLQVELKAIERNVIG
jgi:chromosomal replication initiator protein